MKESSDWHFTDLNLSHQLCEFGTNRIKNQNPYIIQNPDLFEESNKVIKMDEEKPWKNLDERTTQIKLCVWPPIHEGMEKF